MQVKLNVSSLDDISDDIDFCFKLAKEESVIILPGKKQTNLNILLNGLWHSIKFSILNLHINELIVTDNW